MTKLNPKIKDDGALRSTSALDHDFWPQDLTDEEIAERNQKAARVITGIAVARGATKDDPCGLDVVLAALFGGESDLCPPEYRMEEDDE